MCRIELNTMQTNHHRYMSYELENNKVYCYYIVIIYQRIYAFILNDVVAAAVRSTENPIALAQSRYDGELLRDWAPKLSKK